MKIFTHRRTKTMLHAGVGLTATCLLGSCLESRADPVPLVAVRPVVKLLGVREVAPTTQTARGASADSPQPFDPFFDPQATAAPTIPAGYSPPPAMPATGMGYPMPGAAVAANNLPPPWAGYPAASAGSPMPPQSAEPPRGFWANVTGWTNDRMRAVKSTFDGSPYPSVDPRVGQMPQPQPQTLPMPRPLTQPAVSGPAMAVSGPMMPSMNPPPIQGVTPNGRMAYAGNPAYRWYGWGTTTPGANPYAPTGEYPAASSQWYAMSGATPGAFPVPVTHPFRSPPGPDAPAYAVRPSPTPNTAPGFSSIPPPNLAVEPPSGPQPIAESMPFRYVPPDELSTPTSVVPMVPSSQGHAVPNTMPDWRGHAVPISGMPKSPPAKSISEPAWQPISSTSPAPVPAPRVDSAIVPAVASTLVGQSVASSDEVTWQTPSTLDATQKKLTIFDRVRLACGPDVHQVEVKQLGADHVIVRFNAASDQVAERAAKAVSELVELKPFTVTFDVLVRGK